MATEQNNSTAVDGMNCIGNTPGRHSQHRELSVVTLKHIFVLSNEQIQNKMPQDCSLNAEVHACLPHL